MSDRLSKTRVAGEVLRSMEDAVMQPKREAGMDRRNFLRAFGGASTAAVAGAAVATAPSEAEAYDPGAEETRQRYQPDAPDVQAFYRTNGYETLQK